MGAGTQLADNWATVGSTNLGTTFPPDWRTKPPTSLVSKLVRSLVQQFVVGFVPTFVGPNVVAFVGSVCRATAS